MPDTPQFDLLVIGAGPAGIAAAVEAAAIGLSVLLLDDAPRPGGQIWRHSEHAPPHGVGAHWLHRLAHSDARVQCSTAVIDITRGEQRGFVVATNNAQMSRVRAHNILLATGAREQFLPFAGWTLPGVTGAGGGQALLKAGLDVRGMRAIVAGSGPLLLPVAAALAQAGAAVTHVIEQASLRTLTRFAAGLWRSPARAMQAVAYRARIGRAQYRAGRWIAAAAGADRLRTVTITDGRRTWMEPCDMLCIGYGLVPATELAQMAACDIVNGRVRVDAEQRTSVDGIYAAGESTGVAGVDAAIAEGRMAAISIAAQSRTQSDRARGIAQQIKRERAFAARMDVAFELRPELRSLATPDTLVCRCEDVRFGDVAACISIREAKLHTRVCMGACQGRVCAPLLEQLFGWSGHTVRPPAVPAPVAALIADETDSRTPAHAGGHT
jgi:thioredoxin reductase